MYIHVDHVLYIIVVYLPKQKVVWGLYIILHNKHYLNKIIIPGADRLAALAGFEGSTDGLQYIYTCYIHVGTMFSCMYGMAEQA